MRRVIWMTILIVSLFGPTACGAVQRPVQGVVYWGTITPMPTVPILPTPADYYATVAGNTLPTVTDKGVLDQATTRWEALRIADYRLAATEELAFSITWHVAHCPRGVNC